MNNPGSSLNRSNILPISIAAIVLSAVAIVTVSVQLGDFGIDRIDSKSLSKISPEFSNPVTPFSNIAATALIDGYEIWNERPGVAVFDYDRDGDHDFYITSKVGKENRLYNNQGNGIFFEVAVKAGVAAKLHNSTGIAACDFNNDGYQDLYVGSWGVVGDRLDFRSHLDEVFSQDRLFLNNQDGTFEDISLSAFGEEINFRSATSVACADVNGDGWLDIYVANLLDDDFRFLSMSHPGHFNALYINNKNLTFSEKSFEAGVEGPEIILLDKKGAPVVFFEEDNGEMYQGYDPSMVDIQGNRIGDPTGQTHAVLFFDYDEDGDPDLWVANDGDRLHVYRNDSTRDEIKFTSVSQDSSIGKAGAWMGFALADYDGDQDLDVFVTNMGYHPRTRIPLDKINGTCEYHDQFEWGTCLHFLLENDTTVSATSSAIQFEDVAGKIHVQASRYMPPHSLIVSNISETQKIPLGLAAYDFGFGATFFDFENDGDQDLYWLGSTIARGKGPGGSLFPSAGRMLRGDGKGQFQDITVEAHLLDILGVRYDLLGQDFDSKSLNINPILHENGKGLAHGDFNGDGYVDLIGTNSSGLQYKEFPPVKNTDVILQPGPIFLWLNGGGAHSWITLRLQGRMAIDRTGTNADGVGARVLVTTTYSDREEPLVQVQEVRAGSSYLSMDSVELEFGLGNASVVDEVLIFWPSGRKQILNNVPVNRQHLVVEPHS
jgi:hypothetical protein